MSGRDANNGHTGAAGLAAGVFVILLVAALLAPVFTEPLQGLVRAASAGENVVGAVWSSLRSPAMGSALWAVPAITLVAVLIGWGIGRVLARGRWWSALLLLPALLPSYLAYAGFNAVRSPGTPIGDWLALLAQEGHRWAPLVAGRALAVVALGMWAAPIAGVLIARAVREAGELDALARTDGAPWWRRELVILAACRSGVIASGVLVGVIMLGSAVPLHVAQLETPAIRAWRLLAESSPDDWWRSWAVTLPGAVLAALVAAAFARAVARFRPLDQSSSASPGVVGLAAWGVVVVGIAAPVIALSLTIRDASVLRTFWTLNAGALRWSLTTSAVLALGAVGVALLTAFAAGEGGRWTRRALYAALAMTLWAMLLPGVLIGAGVAGLGHETALGVFHALGARFIAVPILAGLLLAASEDPHARDARRLDAPPGLLAGALAWLGAALPQHARGLLGAGLVVGVLALHEIEASVIVQPIGERGLPRVLLDALHFARDDELASGMLGLLMVAAVIAVPAAIAIAPRRPRTSSATEHRISG